MATRTNIFVLRAEGVKYLGTLLCKHGVMEGEIREQVMKGISVVGSLAVVMKGRNVSMDVKRGLRNSILLPTLTYGSENWTWNGAQQLRVRAVEMSYLRGACEVSSGDGLSNASVYKRCGMRERGSGVGCDVVEWVKRSTLRWFGHIERMGNEEFVNPLAPGPRHECAHRIWGSRACKLFLTMIPSSN